MTLSAGTRLGSYEVLTPLGAGGMGEVYRAHDPALGRDVAIKVLPAAVSADPERLRRFEQEARSAGLLNHPNILSIYGFGDHEGAPYVVSELLEGATLRDRMGGSALSPRRAIDYALQVAQGLAAAHEKGIVHRDLKPENLFVTDDGRVKILDFGLAKLTQPRRPGVPLTEIPTQTAGTEPGVVMGTIGYMAPEQLRGLPADQRSDIFSFGAILYEMLAGRRAFRGDSAIETMSAILKEDPPELSETNHALPPALERLVRHCLEKSPRLRIQSARDLAYDLEALSGVSGTAVVPRVEAPRSKRALRAAALAAGGLAVLALAYFAGRQTAGAGGNRGADEPARYKRLTFRRGNVLHGQIAPDGQTIVYSAAWDDRPAELFLARAEGRESRPLGLVNANLLSISGSGELAVLLKKTNLFGTFGSGTLARMPLTGGAPREVLEDVWFADWNPEGTEFAAVHEMEGKLRLEFPIGKTLYETTNPMWGPFVSPKGDLVAFVESAAGLGSLMILNRSGKKKALLTGWIFIDLPIWSASGEEIWFDGTDPSGRGGIHAVSLSGKVRSVTQAPDFILHDISRDGSALVERETWRRGILFGATGEREERDLSWLDSSSIASVSNDGQTILFSESDQGGGEKGSVYLRKTDGSPAVRLGDGAANSLSPDGKWALALERSPQQFVLLPTGAGQPRRLAVGDLNLFGGGFLPDGERIVFGANEPGRGTRGWVLDLAGGKPRPFTPEGVGGGVAVSPDGRSLATATADRKVVVFPIDGGEPRRVGGLEPGEVPIQWSADGRWLYVMRRGELPTKVWRFDLASGKRELWKEIRPADRAGVVRLDDVFVTPDGRFYAYSYPRVLSSDLFLVSGLK